MLFWKFYLEVKILSKVSNWILNFSPMEHTKPQVIKISSGFLFSGTSIRTKYL